MLYKNEGLSTISVNVYNPFALHKKKSSSWSNHSVSILRNKGMVCTSWYICVLYPQCLNTEKQKLIQCVDIMARFPALQSMMEVEWKCMYLGRFFRNKSIVHAI
mmetsp:Transcript_37855/g.64623  ORF Transcript_37855/g.64623 Transcript_37855/m.64623 type:complete len:104 (+) Transcript_37855:875-1186(+)